MVATSGRSYKRGSSAILPLFIAAAFLMICAAAVAVSDDSDAADKFTVDDLSYTAISDSDVKVLFDSYSGTIRIPSSITYSDVTYTVTAIDDYAFRGCKSLQILSIPDTVTSIGEHAFDGCTSLIKIKVENGNSHYCTVNGVLFNEDETVLIQYPAGKSASSCSVPDSVISIRDRAFYGCMNLTSIYIGSSVTSIGDQAFYGCKYLDSLMIPDSVTSIGDQAFYGCGSVVSLSIGSGLTSVGEDAFYDCTSLMSIEVSDDNACYSSVNGVLFNKERTVLLQYPVNRSASSFIMPDSLTSIGDYAFYGCTSLSSIGIGKSVTSIGAHAFDGCISLGSVRIGKSVTSIGDHAFDGCSSIIYVSIPDGVVSIGSSAFYGCTSLTFVDLPDSVTSIGDQAFFGCTSIAPVIIGSGVISIGDRAFYGCISLDPVVIGESVTSIGDQAFFGCSSLTSVKIPESVMSLGSHVFDGCSSLTEIEVSEGNINYCSVDGVLLNKEMTVMIQYPVGKVVSSYTIPDGITSLGSSVFYGYRALVSVTIPDSVTSIGDNAFDGCTSLVTVNFGDGVRSLGDGSFSGCTSLPSVNIPDSVTSIGKAAFSGCKSLTSVVIGDSVISIGDQAFSGCTSLAEIDLSEGDSIESLGDEVFSGCTSLVTVNFGDSITAIGVQVFCGCTSLTSINVSEDNSSYCSVDGILFNKGMSALVQYPVGVNSQFYTIPETVTSIGSYAFSGNTSLISVTFEDTVTSIGDNAFYECTSLIAANIGSGVTSIGDLVFCGCTSLTEINVSKSNDFYTSYNGVLFNKDLTVLIDYPAGKTASTYVIPDSVLTVSDRAFYGCSELVSITLGSGITSIGEQAFALGTPEKMVKCYIQGGTVDESVCGNEYTTFIYDAMYTVTFMSQDGTDILYIVTVPGGSDVIYGGETPSKASDGQYTYIFEGWNDKADQEYVIANITDNITSDMTLYAVFSPSMSESVGTSSGGTSGGFNPMIIAFAFLALIWITAGVLILKKSKGKKKDPSEGESE